MSIVQLALDAPTTDSPGGQRTRDTHALIAAGGSTSPQASRVSVPMIQTPAGLLSPEPPHVLTPWPEDVLADLGACASTLDDIEQVRIALENRLRLFTTPKDHVDKDGKQRGLGWTITSPAVEKLATQVIRLRCDSPVAIAALGDKPPKSVGCCQEHDAERNLTRALRTHPLGKWVRAKEQKGIGEKQGARLLGVIGDPYVRPAMKTADGAIEPMRARTVYELFAYCGLHVVETETGGVAPRRQKGQQANWSSSAKVKALLIATSCKKQRDEACGALQKQEPYAHVPGCSCSAYRFLYERVRANVADRVHHAECRNRSRITPNGCGTREHPEWGAPGSPWRPGHQEQHAVRVVAKEILKDLWREAERIHRETPGGGQDDDGTHMSFAAAGD